MAGLRAFIPAWVLALGLLVPACGTPTGIQGATGTALDAASRAPLLRASFVAPESYPQDLLPIVKTQVQDAADNYHNILHGEPHVVAANPFALALTRGTDRAYVSFGLAPCTTRQDLQLEWRTYSGENTHIVATNPSGEGYVRPPVGDRSLPRPVRAGYPSIGLEFGFPTDIPPAVPAAYQAWIAPLGATLKTRYHAQDMTFAYDPQIFTIETATETLGFVHSSLRSRLMLTNTTFANVQAVAVIAADGRLVAHVAIVDFNPRSYSPDKLPAWRFHKLPRGLVLAEVGQP